jgi:hypothetical protein
MVPGCGHRHPTTRKTSATAASSGAGHGTGGTRIQSMTWVMPGMLPATRPWRCHPPRAAGPGDRPPGNRGHRVTPQACTAGAVDGHRPSSGSPRTAGRSPVHGAPDRCEAERPIGPRADQGFTEARTDPVDNESTSRPRWPPPVRRSAPELAPVGTEGGTAPSDPGRPHRARGRRRFRGRPGRRCRPGGVVAHRGRDGRSLSWAGSRLAGAVDGFAVRCGGVGRRRVGIGRGRRRGGRPG